MGGFLSSENTLMTLLNMLPSGEEGTRIWGQAGTFTIAEENQEGAGLEARPPLSS